MNEDDLQKCLTNPDYLAKQYFFNQKYCMAYDKQACDGDIIKAHTISEKYIKNIAENGHVYISHPSGNHKNNLYEFELKGISSVTHITGFCKHHDNSLFSSFEKTNFYGSYDQIYDITFRALCREYYQKKCVLQFYDRVSKGDLTALDRTGYSQSDHFICRRQHLEKEIKNHKFLYEQLRKVKKCGLKFLLIKLLKLPILTTGVLFPLFNPKGQKIQSENKKQLGFIYNAISINNEAYIIIATVASLHNNVHKEFLSALNSMERVRLINYLLTYFFFNNDNVVMEPKWFNKLDQTFKDELTRLANFQVGHYGETCKFYYELEFDKTINLSEAISVLAKPGCLHPGSL